MQFTKPFWAGIADGSVTVAFRRWRRPTVMAGRPYRTGGGRVEVTSVDPIDLEDISTEDARRAGHPSVAELIAALRTDADRTLFRIEFHRLDEPDPRETLASADQLGEEDVDQLEQRLARLDRASQEGPWTAVTLDVIAGHPGRRAPDLAAMVDRQPERFKLDVRKLKNLGLTRSLRIGYELSPRGRAFLDARASRS